MAGFDLNSAGSFASGAFTGAPAAPAPGGVGGGFDFGGIQNNDTKKKGPPAPLNLAGTNAAAALVGGLAPPAAPAPGAGGGLFGGPAAVPPAPAGGLFGAAPAVTTAAAGLFGAAPAAAPAAAGLFGAAPATTGLFGAAPAAAQVTTGLFTPASTTPAEPGLRVGAWPPKADKDYYVENISAQLDVKVLSGSHEHQHVPNLFNELFETLKKGWDEEKKAKTAAMNKLKTNLSKKRSKKQSIELDELNSIARRMNREVEGYGEDAKFLLETIVKEKPKFDSINEKSSKRESVHHETANYYEDATDRMEKDLAGYAKLVDQISDRIAPKQQAGLPPPDEMLQQVLNHQIALLVKVSAKLERETKVLDDRKRQYKKKYGKGLPELRSHRGSRGMDVDDGEDGVVPKRPPLFYKSKGGARAGAPPAAAAAAAAVAPAGGGLFGAAPAAGGGLFGAPAAAAGGGLFGAPAAAAGGGLFGAPAAAAAPAAAGGGLFGAPAAAAAPAAAGGGLFGAPAAAAAPFGAAAAGGFGAPAAGVGLFGAAAPAAGPAGGLFGAAAAPIAPGFGAAAPAAGPAGGLFGAAAAPAVGGLFGGQAAGFGA